MNFTYSFAFQLLIFIFLSFTAYSASVEECISQFSKRGCINTTTICCYENNCDTFYNSPTNNYQWPPVYNDCHHICPYINEDPIWKCTNLQCQDSPTRTNNQVCLYGQSRQIQSTQGNACVFKFSSSGNNEQGYDNCIEGLYCDWNSLSCQPKLSLLSSCSQDQQCAPGYCWAGQCHVNPTILKFIIIPLTIILGLLLICCLPRCGIKIVKRSKESKHKLVIGSNEIS